jgi:UDPglucose 6-dehydrogenase|tara:strand:+ start:10655 stop:11884 length:1230 start_codon:yes stop_codon:yes gene_type:complete
MKIGFIGLGKLGLPCALVADSKGHEVFGYDISPAVKDILDTKHMPYREEGSPELLKDHNINWSSVSEVVSNSDIIFVPIQTPHDERFEGTTRIPEERVDFDYSYLKAGMDTLSKEIKKQGQDKIVVIISTVLPGTIRNEIKPLLNDHVKLCYNPFFIAMGTTRNDFENPEFVLFGMDDEDAYNKAKEFYATIHSKPVYKCSIEEAEMIKVTYNTYITMKICLANVVMEAAHKLENVNCDNVMKGLFLANERLMSPKYLLGGMGDGGGCHPRDNIALSWLAQKLDMSYDWYENLMICREDQTDWLADLIQEHRGDLPLTILGKCFKKETNLTVGSPSILLKNLLKERSEQVDMYDPWVDDYVLELEKRCYFIGTNHDKFLDYRFPAGSVVLDPWGMIQDQDNVEVIRIGR